MTLTSARGHNLNMLDVVKSLDFPIKIKLFRQQELRSRQISDQLNRCEKDLRLVRARHSEEAMRMRQKEEQQRALHARRAAQALRKQQVVEAVLKVQALVRSLLVRKLVLPSAVERRRRELLRQEREALAAKLKDLRHTMHGITYIEEQRMAAALGIQAWWRGVLAVRVVGVLLLRFKIEEVHLQMEYAATLIQALFRGIRGRTEAEEMQRKSAAKRRLSAEHEHARRGRGAIQIQSWFRGQKARISARKRQERLAKQQAQDMLAADALMEGTRRSAKRSIISTDSPKTPRRGRGGGGDKGAAASDRSSHKGGLPRLRASSAARPGGSGSHRHASTASGRKRAEPLPGLSEAKGGTVVTTGEAAGALPGLRASPASTIRSGASFKSNAATPRSDAEKSPKVKPKRTSLR